MSLSASTRAKIRSIGLAVSIFTVLGGLTNSALGRSAGFGLVNGVLIGIGVGSFEEFYVQSLSGRWFRMSHGLKASLMYMGVIVALCFLALTASHLTFGTMSDLPHVYEAFPFTALLFVLLSMIGVSAIRVVHFVGPGTLLDLMTGKYHRPVIEAKMLMFIDINGSTALCERLGAFATRSLINQFIFDVSKPIADTGGTVYLYKGDGLIAEWDWTAAVKGGAILRTVDAVFDAVARQRTTYETDYGAVPGFRIGIHGGDVVMSEMGDTKRTIGIYGSVINTAARIEEAAKRHHVACALSGDVVRALAERPDVRSLGFETMTGLSVPIEVFDYVPIRGLDIDPRRP